MNNEQLKERVYTLEGELHRRELGLYIIIFLWWMYKAYMGAVGITFVESAVLVFKDINAFVVAFTVYHILRSYAMKKSSQ